MTAYHCTYYFEQNNDILLLHAYIWTKQWIKTLASEVHNNDILPVY